MVIKFSDIECIMFDLDGTLLGITDESFEAEYIKYIARRFSDLIEPKPFIKALMAGTEAMIRHEDGGRLVLESFFDKFTSLTGIDRDVTHQRFDEFYRNEFTRLKSVCEPIPEAREIVDKAQKKGYTVVCATNPVFPEIATKQRLEWTDLSFEDFLHVTHAENSYYCKPNPKYYAKLLEMTGSRPDKTVMVGNDYMYDMSASNLGIKTWLTDRYQGNEQYRDQFKITYEGSLKELLSLI